jgi:hypothetical protein
MEQIKKSSSKLKSFFFAVWTGLEPATPCVTGRYSNQLNYQTVAVMRCKYRIILLKKTTKFDFSQTKTQNKYHQTDNQKLTKLVNEQIKNNNAKIKAF